MRNWKRRINVSQAWNATADRQRVNNVMVSAIYQLRRLALTVFTGDQELVDIIESMEIELGDAVQDGQNVSAGRFDSLWSELYDWADANEVWIETIEPEHVDF